jgi:hypothetical protein
MRNLLYSLRLVYTLCLFPFLHRLIAEEECRCMWMTSGDHVDGFWDHVTSGINV